MSAIKGHRGSGWGELSRSIDLQLPFQNKKGKTVVTRQLHLDGSRMQKRTHTLTLSHTYA